MNIAELMTDLAQQGVQVQANQDKLSVRSSKGTLSLETRQKLAQYKAEILSFLREEIDLGSQLFCNQGLSLHTIGRLISGLSDANSAYRPPIVDPHSMAQKLTVTFRPLPGNYNNSQVLKLREELQEKLLSHGVKIEPWETATVDYFYTIKLPKTGLSKQIKTRIVRAGISAVVDVERHPSMTRKAGIFAAETLYQTYSRFVAKNQKLSIAQIAQLATWAEEHAGQRVQDPTNTQVIVLTPLNSEMANPELPYPQKIKIGLNTLIKNFSEIVIGVSDDQLSILNMNLSDSIFPRQEFDRFVVNSLIPKIFVPILPLPLSRFELGEYDPEQSNYAKSLVTLGNKLAPTGLFPAGSKLSQVIRRKSHRDIVNVIMNGRTGVSYGFVCYIEPPQYIGDREISATQWETLAPVQGFSSGEVRQNEAGRWYVKTKIGETEVFRQIPDIWLVSSRSGANKTNLDLHRDVTRIGLKKKLMFQVPKGCDAEFADIKPSYDIYVMVAIALSAALYTPQLVENGAPMIHFHGYPSAQWFLANERCVGVNNPSVPCGTYESGVFNFLGIHSLATQTDLALVGLIESDHGTNLIARDLDHLLDRLDVGCALNTIELGGKHYNSLKSLAK